MNFITCEYTQSKNKNKNKKSVQYNTYFEQIMIFFINNGCRPIQRGKKTFVQYQSKTMEGEQQQSDMSWSLKNPENQTDNCGEPATDGTCNGKTEMG